MSDPVPPLPPPDSDPERTDLLATPTAADSAAGGPTPPAGASGPLPEWIGRYRVLREVARGGMGAVVAARDPALGRDVAIKFLLQTHHERPGYRERFLEEVRITATLQHPGVAAVYEAGALTDGRPFFAMQFVDGQTLDARLAARSSPTEDLPLFLHAFEQVCQALAYAHSRGVIHRDLKPLNVMLAAYGVVKVLDWGMACEKDSGKAKGESAAGSSCVASVTPPPAAALDALDPSALPTEVLGTPAYMAPEQARGDRRGIDERTDVFGLGGILCAILTGQPLYPGKSVRRAHQRAARADLADAFGRLNASPAARELVALAKRCLAPHPANRPRDAQEVAGALTAYIESDLRRAERDLVRFFEFTLDLCCIARTDGRFHHVNANFTRVLGHSAAELTSRPFAEFVHPDDRANTEAEAEKLTRGLPVVQFRNRYRHADGTYRWFEWVAQSIPAEGIIFAVARDITDRVTQEARARASTDPGAAS